MQNVLAGASGATLGYITGNLPGAYAGYKLARMYLKRKYPMTPPSTPRTPKRFRIKGLSKKWKVKNAQPVAQDSGITTQVDRVTQYYKKSMPRWKRRQWVRFSKKVNAVISKSLGTNSVLFNSQITISFLNGGSQAVGAVTLYGIQGINDTVDELGCRDVFRMAKNDNRIFPPGLGTMASPGKVQFKSAVLDFTFRNPNTFGLELDVYEIVYTSDNSGQISLINLINEAVNKTTQIPGSSGGSYGIYNRGVTLFDLPNAIGAGGLKIIKKKKFFLPEGGTATLQHRDPKNHWFNANDFTSQNSLENYSFSKKYMTRSFLLVAKSVVAEQTEGGTLKIGCTRKYSYGVQDANISYDSLNPPN